MTDALHIRHATEDDAAALLDLYEHLSPGDERCPLERAKANINRIAQIDGSAILLGLRHGAVITSCTLLVVPNLTRGGRPYAIIENVVTHAHHRGQGLGKAILDAACERAWDQGGYKVMLSTGSARPSVLSFYKSAGFDQSRTGFQKRRLPPRDATRQSPP